LIQGRLMQTFTFLLTLVLVVYNMQRYRKRDVPYIRRLEPIEQINVSVRSAAELKRPVVMHVGSGALTTQDAVQTMAGLAVTAYVAELSARYGADLRVPVIRPDVFPSAIIATRKGYEAAGKLTEFDPLKTVLFMSGDFMAAHMQILSIIQEEKAYVAILMGSFTGDTNLMGEGTKVGGADAITISGLARITHVAFFVVLTDFALIGEELLVAGAYLSKDRASLGSIVAQDWMKVIAVVLLVAGGIMATFSSASSLISLLSS